MQKVESSSKKSVHVASFIGPRQTCFAASDVSSLYGLTPAQFYPIRIRYSRNLQQPDLLQFTAKQVKNAKIARFYYPFTVALSILSLIRAIFVL